ncbi:hypothetical protein EJ08DRAFT_32090 [Tothia fuscella]|uniref:Uncharacterized protein n=1 Tax=Tothia fuscella TaxID=1048955 RepID=A0A9P4NG70_9PEZI|nr:hypothetical protein EJ08DRAFT_32090 [Tothia fuscella]
MPSGFLDCPAEIRIKFYRYCLFLGEPVEIGAFRDEMPTLSNSGESVEVCASSQLLRVCHQVLKEAEPILYSENTFSILSREGVNLFCAQAGRKVELIQKISICSLTCTFIIDQTGPGRFTTRKLFAPFRGLKEVRLQICNPIPTGQFEYDPAKNCLITSKDFTLNLSARFFDVVNAYVTELLSMGVSVLFDVSMGPIVFLSATNNSIAVSPPCYIQRVDRGLIINALDCHGKPSD